MRKHILQPKTSDIFIPISIGVILVIGIFISIVQIQQPQQNKTSAQTAIKNCDVASSELMLSTDEKAMFDAINKYRKDNGLNELNYNDTLQRPAQWMSNDMAVSKNLSHTDSLGRNVENRLKECGLVGRSWGENISEGYRTVEKAFEAWKNSPGHNANMLGKFTHMGVAEKNTYWTLDLAEITNGNTSPPPVSGVPTQATQLTAAPSASVSLTPPSSPTSPDLVVSDMESNNNGVACGPIGVRVTIKNQGAGTSSSVVVRVNSTIGTIGGGIAAGASKSIWLPAIVSGENAATVDPNNSVAEANENNNQLKRILIIPTKSPSCVALTPTKPAGATGRDPLTPAPTAYPGFVLNPNDTQVLISAKFPGVGINGNKSPKNLSRKVTVTVYDLNNEKVVEGVAFLTYDKNDLFRGIVHLGKGINDTYYVKVGADHTLQELVMPIFQPLLNDRLNVLSPVVLIKGELNGDNQLTIADYNIALTCFQDKLCGTKPKTDANEDGKVDIYDAIDLNDDGKANVVDYNYLLHNFKEFGGD